MDDVGRLRSLLELYESALEAVRELGDPALEELETRLEARAAAAAHDYYELLRPAGGAAASWSSRPETQSGR